MIDSALVTKHGGRDNNEDYVTKAVNGTSECFILCDGLGGHDCGEVASSFVAEYIADMFRKTGDTPSFLQDAFNAAQTELLKLQQERHMTNAMRTTLVVLVVTDAHMKWAHIGDSRLYHIFNNGTKYERTRDHSMVQLMCDMGEIKESEMRHHEERNKLLRVMGAEWGNKSFDKSAILERDGRHAFVLMTDGFWEYVDEENMLRTLADAGGSQEWLDAMEEIVVANADMSRADNYSAICVRVD